MTDYHTMYTLLEVAIQKECNGDPKAVDYYNLVVDLIKDDPLPSAVHSGMWAANFSRLKILEELYSVYQTRLERTKV